MSEFEDFLRKHGISLTEINPGSTEYALLPKDALQALEIVKSHNQPILGGDVLATKENNTLAYAYQIWGDQYHTLNWYCDKRKDESEQEFEERTYSEAKNAINNAVKVVNELGGQTYIVLVV